MPTTYQENRKRLQSPNASLRDISEIINMDPAMSLKILQLVNSACFGLNRKISDITEASSIMGLDALSALVLSTGIFSQYKNPEDKDFSMLIFLQHSMDVAKLSKLIAKSEGANKTEIEHAFLAGLLHDLGVLILMQNRAQEFLQFKASLKDEKLELQNAEIKHFGAHHGAIGAYLLSLWGIASPVVKAVAYHHHPADSMDQSFSALTAVHVAGVLSSYRGMPIDSLHEREVDIDYLERIGCLDRMETWRELRVTED
jgi:putative nucleotidyltransferase with HDIG domain